MTINKETKTNFKKLALCTLFAFLITLVSLFIVACFMHIAEIDSKYSSPLSSIGLAVGCFFGGFIYSKSCGKKGLVCGVTISLIFYIIILLVSLISGFGKLGVNTLIHMIITLLSGGIGGILGVNLSKKIKI